MKINSKYLAVLKVNLEDGYLSNKDMELYEVELKQALGEDIQNIEYFCTCCETSLCGDIKSLCTLCTEYHSQNNYLNHCCYDEVHITFEKTKDLKVLGPMVVNARNKILRGITIESKLEEKKDMERIQVANISKETKDLISSIMGQSYLTQHLGLECDDCFIEKVIQGIEIDTNIVKDNLLTYGEYDVLYVEEDENTVRIKDGLTEDEMRIASKQLDDYLKELTFVSMVNFKIKEIHKLILEGCLA